MRVIRRLMIIASICIWIIRMRGILPCFRLRSRLRELLQLQFQVQIQVQVVEILNEEI